MLVVSEQDQRLAEEKRMAPVRAAKERMKPYLEEAKLILDEL